MKPIWNEWYSFLETHYRFLKAIHGLLFSVAPKFTTISQLNQLLVPSLVLEETWKEKAVAKDAGLVDEARRHLQNAWFNECALRYPMGDDLLSERMRFAPWRISQFYYTIYSGISSMVRFVNSKPMPSHTTTLNFFVSAIAADERLRTKLFPIPLGFILKEGGLIPDSDHVHLRRRAPGKLRDLRECLESTRHALDMKQQVGVVHYFRWLREWANYRAGYIFANLYGPRIREVVDGSLAAISNCFMAATERFAISFLGIDEFAAIYGNFRAMVIANLRFEPDFSLPMDERVEMVSRIASV